MSKMGILTWTVKLWNQQMDVFVGFFFERDRSMLCLDSFTLGFGFSGIAFLQVLNKFRKNKMFVKEIKISSVFKPGGRKMSRSLANMDRTVKKWFERSYGWGAEDFKIRKTKGVRMTSQYGRSQTSVSSYSSLINHVNNGQTQNKVKYCQPFVKYAVSSSSYLLKNCF